MMEQRLFTLQLRMGTLKLSDFWWSPCQQTPRHGRWWSNASFHCSSSGAPWNCPSSGGVRCQQRPRQDWYWSNASFHCSSEGAPWSCEISGGVRCHQYQGKTNDGATPLYIAAQNGHLEVVRFLVESGANKDQGTADDGATPLYIAAQNGHLEVVRFLLESGANKDQGTADDGATPLYIAAQNGHLEVVRFLVQSGANKDQCTTDNGVTPLFIADVNGHLEVVRCLVESGAQQWQGPPSFTVKCHEDHLGLCEKRWYVHACFPKKVIDQGVVNHVSGWADKVRKWLESNLAQHVFFLYECADQYTNSIRWYFATLMLLTMAGPKKLPSLILHWFIQSMMWTLFTTPLKKL